MSTKQNCILRDPIDTSAINVKNKIKTHLINWPSFKKNIDLKLIYDTFIKKGIYKPPSLETCEKKIKRDDLTPICIWMIVVNKLLELSQQRLKILQSFEIDNSILEEYNEIGILRISLKYDFPPLAFIEKIINFKKFKTTRDSKNFKTAMRNDVSSPSVKDFSKQLSDKYEMNIRNMFRDKNISFKTENSLKHEQIQDFGKALCTVDILFLDNVHILDPVTNKFIKINWLEVKTYTLTENEILLPKIKKQLTKYVSKWGHGAVLFKYGYTIDLDIKGVFQLDGTDVKKLDFADKYFNENTVVVNI